MPHKDKEQRRAYSKIYRETHREQIVAYRKAYQKADREQIEAQKAGRRVTREQITAAKRASTLRKYGLTPEMYNTLLDLQEHCCRLCGSPDFTYGSALAVDHCHRTGKVRKLLCNVCNRGLGCFRDDPELLERAALYLKLHM